MRKTRWISVLLVTGLIVAGCGDKSKNPTEPEKEQTAVPEVVVVKGPTSQNAPPQVKMATNMMSNMANLGHSFLAAVQSTQGTKTGDSYVWTYTEGQATVTFISTPTGDGINWEVKLNGVYGDVQVQNFVYLKGFSSSDGKSGWWEGYDLDTGEKAIRYEWTTDNQGTVHATLTTYGDSPAKFEVVNNKDGSGSLVVYQNGVKTLQATWQANGSGTYTVWDEDGNVVDQGNWT